MIYTEHHLTFWQTIKGKMYFKKYSKMINNIVYLCMGLSEKQLDHHKHSFLRHTQPLPSTHTLFEV